MYTVTLNELTAMSARAKHSGTVNKTLSEPMTQDDKFQEVKIRKRHNSNENSTVSQELD
jgi:hypothetical protein